MEFKAVVTYGDRKVNVNFNGTETLINKRLRELGFDRDLKHVCCGEVQITIKKVSNGILEKIIDIIKPNDRIFDVFTVCRTCGSSDELLLQTIITKIKSRELKSCADIDIFTQKYHLINVLKSFPVGKYDGRNAMEKSYEEISLFGKPVLFTPDRIDHSTVPKSLYVYEVQSDDGGDMCCIATHILFNHWGTIISNRKITLPISGYLEIDEDNDTGETKGKCNTIEQYHKCYPTKRKNEQER